MSRAGQQRRVDSVFDPHTLSDLGLGKPEEQEAATEALRNEKEGLLRHLGEPRGKGYKSVRPFGVSAYDRIQGTNVNWLYEIYFGTCSDYVHMNARAIDSYVRVEDETWVLRTDPEPASIGLLVVGMQIALRMLYVANEALGLNQTEAIDGLATEYWRLNHTEGLDLEWFLEHLRG